MQVLVGGAESNSGEEVIQMQKLIVYVETTDVPLEVVKEEVVSWLNDLITGAWADTYGKEGVALDCNFQLFDGAGDWQPENR